MHGAEAGDEQFSAGERGFHLVDAGVGVVRGGLGRRQRLVDFPGERHTRRPVLREQVVEHRRASARLADDHDRRHHVSCRDLRMLGAVAHDASTRHEVTDQLAGHDLRAELVELSVAPQRVDEPFEWFSPGHNAEVVGTARRCRGGDDHISVESQLGHGRGSLPRRATRCRQLGEHSETTAS